MFERMKKPLIGLFAALTLTAAQAWPDRPITLVVPYTPGTGIDLIARQLSAKLPAALGVPVVVDNVPGASGNIGTEKVVRAQPDGNTLLVQVSTLVMNPSLYKSIPYDPVRDLAPVTLTSWGTLLLVTNPAVQKAGTLAQMIDAAKADPGKLTYASPGVGTPHHLAMALLQQNAGIDLLHVPYKGTAGAVTDLLGGRIDFMFLPIHVALQQIQAGKLKALATGSDRRAPQLPDVPTLREAGVATGNLDMWYGVLAPNGTPQDVINRLNQEIGKVLKDAQVADAFAAQGMVPATSTPAAFGALLDKDAKRWAEVVRKGSITAE